MSAETRLVDVIVPVYGAFSATMHCLFSVLGARCRARFEIVVVDDASPDPALAAALDELAASGRITLLRNAENLGFVRSANRAMRLHPERDVVLLNSDTEVFGDWLDRMLAAAAGERVATVTPFSNNAEICSYPRFVKDNAEPLEIAPAELDALFAEVNRGATAELPTAVGFCMFVARACLNQVGLFDEERFGAGYGEENDLCLRARAAGWRNLLAGDVFVPHAGAASFGDAKRARAAAAWETLTHDHPDYAGEVARFIEFDPLEPLRRRIDVERVRRHDRAGTFLLVTHNREGGTEQHVADLTRRIVAAGGDVLIARSAGGTGRVLRLESPSLEVPNLPAFDVRGEPDAFAEALGVLGVVHLHVHHLADFPPEAADFLRLAAARAGIPYDVTVHDYFFICPRINLVDSSSLYCGEPGTDGCARCLHEGGSEFGRPPIEDWRARYDRFLRAARTVFVPDAEVAIRLGRYFPGLAFAVRPHPEPVPLRPLRGAPPRSAPAADGAPVHRRVGLIGAIYPLKGSRQLLHCARIARERGLPLEFVVVGFSDIDDELREAGVTITGGYAQDDLDGILAREPLDLAWFPSVWPETYCYTLSAAIRAGLFPVAFDIGAIATRVRALDWGLLLPVTSFFDPESVLEALLTAPLAPFPAGAPVLDEPYPSFIEDYYALASRSPRAAAQ
ncbi:MAG TPA: glycosyltransferase [Candidatus Elarobacter sp.]|nr:glycosyltransferase [Candidatus Elarobacter sp.]